MQPNENLKITLRHHVIFWLIYFLLNTLRWGNYFDNYTYSLKTNLLGFPIHMILCYLNIFVLMPKLVFKRKYLLYLFFLVLLLMSMVIIKFNLTYFFISTNIWPESPTIINEITSNYAINMMIGELYVITFVTAIKVTIDWLQEQKRVTALQKIQLESELLFLRTQISPHFFFNTLNNIYSLAIEKSDKTPKLILRLSELMRYLIYETKSKRQSLEKEIICIENYLDLERLRHGSLLKTETKITGDISDKKIAPILLLSFIENAFKHGANKTTGEVKIEIDFKILENFLYFTISNPLPETHNKSESIEKSSGIGLKNVKKRLELGYKPEDYSLDIQSTNELFVVKLKIKV